MNEVRASLDRFKALWHQLEHAKPGTAKYDALVKQIRAETDIYRALVEAKKRPKKD